MKLFKARLGLQRGYPRGSRFEGERVRKLVIEKEEM
jgi:hypothetical protein